MPALSPKCATYVEDGANFIHGNEIKNLFKVSTDGYVKCRKHKTDGLCSSILNYDHYDMTVECKCPFPNEYNVPVHYSLPNRYVTQILAGTCAKRVLCCLYVSHSKSSTIFFNALLTVIYGMSYGIQQKIYIIKLTLPNKTFYMKTYQN